MNRLESNRRAALRMLFTAALCCAASSLLAGEPIILPTEKAKTAAPVDPKTAVRQPFHIREKPDAPIFDVLHIPIAPSLSEDVREDTRHRLRRRERQNWMIVPQGELQAEEEAKNFLGVRDYSMDAIDKDSTRENLMFRPLKKGDDRRMPGQFRSANDDRYEPQPTSTKAKQRVDVDFLDSRDKESRQSIRRSEELDFNWLREPRQAGDSLAPKFNKSDLTLQGLLNPVVDPAIAREREAKLEEFRSFLNKSTDRLAGPLDSINSPNDLTRQPLNPTMPQTSDRNAATDSAITPFGATPAVKSSPLSATFGAAPRPSATLSAGPFAAPQDSTRSRQKPLTFETPKRKF